MPRTGLTPRVSPALAMLLAAGLLCARPEIAPASPANPRISTVNPALVGSPARDPITVPPSIAGPEGPGFHIDLRGVNNAPLLGHKAMLDFSACPSMRMSTEQDSGVTMDCAKRRLIAVTTTGNCTFFPRFGG